MEVTESAVNLKQSELNSLIKTEQLGSYTLYQTVSEKKWLVVFSF